MCGIMGIIGLDGLRSRACIAAMARRLAHRGPDDFGIFIGDRAEVALAHHRLSILDLSANGRQPMLIDDGRFTITFNGEIYNYCELREELIGQGFHFVTSSDTEVLLKGYQAWGEQVLDRLVGMFAFAVWDAREQSLFLARDRVGKKPLVYVASQDVFAFASELKAVLEVPGCSTRLDPDAVDAYLVLGYVPAPLTIFQGIRKLQPGHSLKWRKGKTVLRRYWCPETACSGGAVHEDPLEAFQQLFRESVRLRLRSDVPVGLFLSGGIDSSAIAAECAALGHPVDAFTVVFEHDTIDLPHAVEVAGQLGLRHEVVRTSARDVMDDLVIIHRAYDEPFADSSNIPCYAVARHTQGRFKVILTGDGGDEAFAGYPHYEFAGLKQTAKRWAAAIGLKDGDFRNRWDTYFKSKALFNGVQRAQLLQQPPSRSDFSTFVDSDPFLNAAIPPDTLHLALWADRHVCLPNDLLYKMDIALMAHGIEGRSPFLDHRLLEWSQRLAKSQLVKGRSKKRLLRAAYAGRLSPSVLNRRKHGFGSPVTAWLRGPLNRLLADHLPTPLLCIEPQKALIERFRARPTAHRGNRLWTLLAFSMWAKQWSATW